MASKKLGGKFNCLSRRGKLLSASDIFGLENKSNGAFWLLRFVCFELARQGLLHLLLLEEALAEMVETTWYKTKWYKTTSERVLA